MPSRIVHRVLISITVIALLFASVITSYAETINYIYDELNRLKRVEYGDGTVIEYTYDGAGNRIIVQGSTPPTGTITINSEATYANTTSATLTLTCTDANGCSQMRFSNDNVTYSTPEAYSTTKAWTLTPSDGTKTVYAKFKDTPGNWSIAYSDTILLDTTAPVTTASPAGGTYNTSQSVTLTCNDGTGSGCDKIYYTTDGTTPTTSSPPYSSPINISVSTTLKFFAKDLAGNSESVKTEIYTIGDVTPPTPNPMAWATEPYETSTSSISMVATAATDPTTPINYYFEFSGSPTGGSGGTSSAWQSSRSFTDSGLSPNHQYGYRVKARDGKYNETGFSPVSYDYTDIETPSGITFGTVTNNSIQAKSTNTPSGLARGSSGMTVYNVTKVTDSGWKQDNNYWTSGLLSVNTRYAFRAKARNGDADETPYSGTIYRYTSANAPGVAAFSNITPVSVQANWTANGNPAGTKYYCENTTRGTNSGWITNTYWSSTGLTCGSYSFRVKAKNGDGVETPWTVSGSISPICGPDLTETSVSNPPSAVILGGTFSVTDIVKNQGSQASGPSVTQYYLSTDAVKGSTDKHLTGSRSVLGLVVGGTSTGTVTVAVPSTVALGSYYLLACADDMKVVTETYEDNNCKTSTSKVLVTLPDLIVTSVSNPPATATPGSSFSITDTVKNQGSIVSGSSITRYYLSTNTAKDATDPLLTGSRTVPALNAGGTSTGTVTVAVPSATPLGTYYLLACADDTNGVTETNENNNCKASGTKIQINP